MIHYAPLASGFQLSNGKALIAFYIPLPLSIGTLVWNFLYGPWNNKSGVFSLLIFLILILPLTFLWFSSYNYLPQDDGYRYNLMAEEIARSGSLWGADDLVFNTSFKYYLFQPGYKYYVAGYISVMGKETRLFQLWNMFLYLIAVTTFLYSFRKDYQGSFIEKGTLAFLLLSSPFVVKLIMIGLSEWLLACLLLFLAASILQRKMVTAIVCLALIPFIRQNLLISTLLLFPLLLYHSRFRWHWILVYVSLLLLPLYHNLYYAGVWKWLSTYPSSYGYLTLFNADNIIEQWGLTIGVKLFSYTGIHLLHPFSSSMLVALAFIPLGTALYIMILRKFRGKEKVIFLSITLSSILPTIILGGQSYFPRFEWVNLLLALLVYIMLKDYFLNKKSA